MLNIPFSTRDIKIMCPLIRPFCYPSLPLGRMVLVSLFLPNLLIFCLSLWLYSTFVGHGMQQWPILRYHPSICMEELDNTLTIGLWYSVEFTNATPKVRNSTLDYGLELFIYLRKIVAYPTSLCTVTWPWLEKRFGLVTGFIRHLHS
jgi:hypothetical protein